MKHQKGKSSKQNRKCFAIFLFCMLSLYVLSPCPKAPAQEVPEGAAAPSLRLSQALHHYYNEEYNLALPMFEALAADEGENEDLMFWIGVCAYKTGDFAKAVDRFETLIRRRPDFPRVRLELAMACFQMGRYDRAKAEILKAREFPAPDDVRREMDDTLRLIESHEKRGAWSAGLSTGYRYDSNATAGPDVDVVDDTLYVIPLSEEGREQEDGIWLTDFSGVYTHDAHGPGGLLMTGALSVMDRRYFEYSDLDYTEMTVSGGPAWDMAGFRFSLPVGYTQKLFGGDSLSGVIHGNALAEWFLTDQISLLGNLKASGERFSNDDFADAGLDNSKFGLWAGTAWRSSDRLGKFALHLGGETRSADADHQSYDSLAANLSYVVRLIADTDLYLAYTLTDYTYDEQAPWYDDTREDTRREASVSLARQLYKQLHGVLKYTYLDNDSNLDLYSFDKHTASLQIGLRF